MPRIKYIDWKPRATTLVIVEQANAILNEYKAAGYDMTLRQLYYQFVARGLLGSGQKQYNMLGTTMSKARRAGLIDWDLLKDRTRKQEKRPHWTSPGDIIDSCAESYSMDLWKGQHWRPEVWVEKEALAGVVERTCTELDVPYFACRGYVSLSEMWSAAHTRFRSWQRWHGQRPLILHFGDHDPSGMDMTRDIEDRLNEFAPDAGIKVIRCALNMEQIEEFNPPPFWAKLTDSRAKDYIAEYGTDAWELDALQPQVIDGLIRKHIDEHIHQGKWDALKEAEMEGRAQLTLMANNWDDVEHFVRENEDDWATDAQAADDAEYEDEDDWSADDG